MSHDRTHAHDAASSTEPQGAPRTAPGKRSPTERLQRKTSGSPPPPSAAAAPPWTDPTLFSGGSYVDSLLAAPVQRRATAAAADDDVHALAAEGTAGAGGRLPFLDRIQASFGAHDVGRVVAHTDAAAARAAIGMGAAAFASGQHVAFAGAPDLHTAAHEAAHVVQQRAGVHLKGGVGEDGDAYERHADDVADAVVRGESAEGLLDELAGSGGAARAAVQRRSSPKAGGWEAAADGLTVDQDTVPTSWFVDFRGAGTHGMHKNKYQLEGAHGDRKPTDVLLVQDLHVGPLGKKGKSFTGGGNALPHGAAHLGDYDHPRGDGRASGIVQYAAASDLKVKVGWGVTPAPETPAEAKALDAQVKAAEKAATDHVVAELQNPHGAAEGNWDAIRAAAAARAEAALPDHAPTIDISYERPSQRFTLGPVPYQVDAPAQCSANVTVPTTTTYHPWHKTVEVSKRKYKDVRTHDSTGVHVEKDRHASGTAAGEAEAGGSRDHVKDDTTKDRTKASVDTKLERNEVFTLARDITTHVHRVAQHGWTMLHTKLLIKQSDGVVEAEPEVETPGLKERAKSWLKDKYDKAMDTVKDLAVDGIAKVVKTGLKQMIAKKMPGGERWFTPIGWGIDWLADKVKGKIHATKTKDEKAPDGFVDKIEYDSDSRWLHNWIRDVKDITTRETMTTTTAVNSLFQSHWEHEHDSSKRDLLIERMDARAKASGSATVSRDDKVVVDVKRAEDRVVGSDDTDREVTSYGGTTVQVIPGHPILEIDVIK